MAAAIPLQGVVLITGAAGGIGLETGLAFAEAGARAVVFADLDEAGAQESAAQSKSLATNPEYRALAIGVDVRDEASVQAMVDSTVKEFGRIDYSVNSAGLGNSDYALTHELSVEHFDAVAAVNTRGVMLCVRAVSAVMARQEPLMYSPLRSAHQRSLGRGSIVNLGSMNSYAAAPGMLSYTTSKHAVLGITKSAALDNVRHHIRVNAVCPAWVDTPMMARSLKRMPQLGAVIERVSPLKRAAGPDEVAGVILFLCSPAASYVNGVGLPVDAGIGLTAQLGR